MHLKRAFSPWVTYQSYCGQGKTGNDVNTFCNDVNTFCIIHFPCLAFHTSAVKELKKRVWVSLAVKPLKDGCGRLDLGDVCRSQKNTLSPNRKLFPAFNRLSISQIVLCQHIVHIVSPPENAFFHHVCLSLEIYWTKISVYVCNPFPVIKSLSIVSLSWKPE